MNETPATVPPTPPAGPTEADRHFRTDHLLGDLKGRSVRGGAVTLSSQAIKFVLQTGSTMVLARQLTPEDFGLIAMVMAVTGLVAMFKDAGLSMATVQRADINQGQVSTLFWVNVALSTLVMLVLAALAPVIAWFYGEPRLLGIALTLAAISIFGGLAGQHQALLRRQMRFRDLAIIEILSMITGITTAILMAVAGFGYWSLVGLTAAAAIANCALVWAFSGWRPGRPVRGSGVRPMIRFGAGLTLGSFFSHVGDQFPYILIGYSLGSGPLALYERAYRLLIMPLTRMLPAIAGVAIPALSRVQNDPVRQRRIVRKLIPLVVSVSVPVSVIGIVLAPEIILFMLGSQWVESATLFACLAPLAAAQPISAVVIWLLLTSGRTDILLRFHATNAVLIAISILVGLRYGLVGAALAVSLVGVLVSAPILFACAVRYTAITLGDLLAGSWLMVTTGAGLVVAGLLLRQTEFVTAQSPWLWAGTFGVVVVVCWLPIVFLMGVPQIIRSARSL